MLNVGIVGFGKMGMLHGALLNASKKAKLVAICDKSFFMRFAFKKVYKNVRCYKDLDKMLQENKIDLLIISTPSFDHVTSSVKGIKNNCSLFIEKPLSSNIEDAKILYNLSKEKNVKIQVGFCNRYTPSLNMAKNILLQNKIGIVEKANAYMYIADVFEEHDGWRYNKEISGGGVLMDFGIHMIDLLYWYFGEVESVSANGKSIYSKNVEDEMDSILKFKNGVVVDYKTSWSKEEFRKSFSKLEIFGDKGTMIVSDQTIEILDKSNNRLEYFSYPELYNGSFIDIGGILYSKQIEELLDYCLNDKEPLNTISNAVYVQNLVDVMYRSSENNGEFLEVNIYE